MDNFETVGEKPEVMVASDGFTADTAHDKAELGLFPPSDEEPEFQSAFTDSLPDQGDMHLDMQELIDNTHDLHACPINHAVMICASTGTWDDLLEICPELAKNPLKAFAALSDLEYSTMKKYFTQRSMEASLNETDEFWNNF